MPLQGIQNEKHKYGGTRYDPRDNDSRDVNRENKFGKHSRKHQPNNEYQSVEMEEKEIQDGEVRSTHRSDPMAKIARHTDDGQDRLAIGTLISERYDSNNVVTDNADIVVQKVDEWLKHRSDSLSSIEFDNEIKTVEDYEFSRLDQDGEENYPTSSTLVESSQKTSSCTPSLSSFAVSGIIGSTKMSPLSASLCQSKVQDTAPCLLDAAAAGIYRINDGNRFGKSKDVPDSLQISPLTSESKSIMLMTPQELERMPDSGIEFEESVGPKELETLGKQEEPDGLESELIRQALQYPRIEDVHHKNDVFQDMVDVKCSILQEETHGKGDILQDAGEATTALNVPTSVSSTLATISISTDNDTNTTCIIINTKLGQREFKINTANLMQAAATLQPMTLADLVDQSGIPVTSVEPGLASDVSRGENSEIYHEMSVEDIAAEPLTSTNLEKVPIKGCKIKEKAAEGTVCTHTGRCKKVWTCPEPSCGKVYTKQYKLKVHMMLHSGVRPYKCEVEGCDWAFTTLYKLKRHLETHCGAKDFVCDFEGCTRTFTTVYNLNSHKKLHVVQNSIACPIENCNKHFPTRRKMEMHMKEHSEIDAPYKCTFESCGKMYYTANSMASHLRVHQKTNFQCSFEGCNKVFDKLSRYKVHMWHHTGERPYVCSFEGCNWAFSSASKLKRHMRKHTGERKYPCKEPGCNKSFMRLEHLQGHLVIHRGDKPFWCSHENCEAKFTAKSSLYVHMKKHTDSVEKIVYPCPIENCDKKYNCKSSLRIHMLRYHTPVLADVGQVDFVTLLSNEELQDVTTVNSYEQVIEQQNPMSVTAPEQNMLTPATLTSNDIVEVTTMVIGELPSDETSPSITSHQLATTEPSLPTCQSELETLSTLCVLQQNNSGSARTDFCSNHMLMDRVRKRRLLQQESHNVETVSELDDQTSEKVFVPLTVPQLASDDIILSTTTNFHNSTAIGMNFIRNQVLPDDPPPPHGDAYPEDGLLTSMANKLSVPISLLAEQPVASSGQSPDFGNSQKITEFTGTTINLQDLE